MATHRSTLIWLIFSLPLIAAYPTVLWNISAIDNISMISTKINMERKIEKVVIINAHFSKEFCLTNYDLKTLSANKPILLLKVNKPCQNSGVMGDTLLICCLPKYFVPDLLKNMIYCLGGRRSSRIVFIWNTEHTSNKAKERVALQKQQQRLFEFCAQKHLLNVISIYRDYLNDGHFYTYSYFPEFHLQRKPLTESCFPDRIKDLQGAAIKALPKYNEPYSLMWRNRSGHIQMGGYFSKILEEFVKRHNATLTWPIPFGPETRVPIPLWITLLQNDTIDIVIGLAPIEYISGFDISTVVLLADWTIMLPLPTVIPDSEILLIIINSLFGLILLVLLLVFALLFTAESILLRRDLNRKYGLPNCITFFLNILINLVLRSMLGQSSYMSIDSKGKTLRRFIYCILFLSGIFISTLTSAAFNSYLTSPLRYSQVNTFKELVDSDIEIKITKFEYETLPVYLGTKHFQKLNQTFKLPPETKQLATTMDTRYGYTILGPLWSVIARYQKFLPRPLFYVSENIYLTRDLPLCIPLHEHSIYKEAFNQMILLIHSNGLTDLWTRQSYDDMVKAGKINITTHLGATSHVWGLQNFYYVWWMYGVGVGVSIIVFFAEILYYQRQTKKSVPAHEDK